jgi:plastocyanin
MSVRRSRALVLFTAFAACGGGDDGGATPPADGPQQDSQVSKVMEVTCPATPAAMFMTSGITTFEPKTAAITLGQIVQFVSTSLEHPIGKVLGDPQSDPGLVVGGGKTKCFNFLERGVYKFQCTTHQYVGTLTVN